MAKGDLIKKPDRRFKLLVLTQGLWVATLLVLAVWWGTLLKQQSDEIANLETQLGVPEAKVQRRLDKTEHMISAESGTFIFLILLTNGILLFFYARDTKRSKSLEAFFASITHELRTPLTSIRLQAEALKDIEDNPKHTPFLNRLLEDVSRLEGQVQETLELARIEGGGTLHSEALSIKNFILSRILPQYPLGDARLKSNLSLSEGYVLADSTALNIIFRNLIDNALKYSKQAPTEIEIKGEKSNTEYFLDFSHLNSNFSGDASQLGSLFQRGTNSNGAGIGLYLTQTLTQKMKGKVTYSFSNGNFKTTLTLPLESSETSHG